MPMLAAAVPSFAPLLEEYVRYNYEPGDERLPYLEASHLCRHLIEFHKGRDVAVVRAFFDFVERLHVEGDDYVRQLATVGFLEDTQTWATTAGVPLDEIEALLLTESKRWWTEVVEFWAGRRQYIGEGLE